VPVANEAYPSAGVAVPEADGSVPVAGEAILHLMQLFLQLV
jgi:hypothetical protein